jgi:hypothetical protein
MSSCGSRIFKLFILMIRRVPWQLEFQELLVATHLLTNNELIHGWSRKNFHDQSWWATVSIAFTVSWFPTLTVRTDYKTDLRIISINCEQPLKSSSTSCNMMKFVNIIWGLLYCWLL